MIPTKAEAFSFFDRFQLPSQKRIHVQKVAQVALIMAKKLQANGTALNFELIEIAALLHDIDKNIPKQIGERHPDTAVRILTELGYAEIAEIVETHSLHCILDPVKQPKTWEQKLVYLSDKMVKSELIGIEVRFGLWFAENLPQAAQDELIASLPKVKALEAEIYQIGNFSFTDLQKEVQNNLSLSVL